jgi:alpha-N-acetylglucosamine transferase
VTNKGKYERWNYTFDKLQAFNLTEFEKVVFLDSDMMLVRNVDHLFKAPHMSAVVADVFDQPGCNQLNSGLMVIQPSASEFLGMMKMVSNGRFSEMFACGDQDIIRAYFKDWHANTELRLPIGYNLYYPFVHCFDKSRDGEIYNIHFVYDKKPWQLTLTQVLRRLRRHNWCYLLRYLRMVHKFRALLRKKGINL